MKFTGERARDDHAGAVHPIDRPGRTARQGRGGPRARAVAALTRFEEITRLASTRTYPLRSSFQPSYNMAVNLVRNYELHEAEHLVNSSFGQFQSDRSVVRLENAREKDTAYLASYRERMKCDVGDIEEYRDLLTRLQKIEGRMSGTRTLAKRVNEGVLALNPGDVIKINAGRKRGRYAVIEVVQRKSERKPRVLAVSGKGALIRFGPADLVEPPRRLGRLSVEERQMLTDPDERKGVAERIKTFVPEDGDEPFEGDGVTDEERSLRAAVESHPVAKCPHLNRHLHYAERAERLERDIRNIERRIARTTGTLARRFDQVLAVLETLDYVTDWELSEKGELLTSVYNESDLLVIESLRTGFLNDLEPEELAAVCSTLVYETRGPEGPPPPDMPTPACQGVWRKLMQTWRRIRAEEEGRQLDLTREPDPGFASRAYRWASGARSRTS